MPSPAKRPTQASLKRVNAENLAGLGVERLAELLLEAANARPELKRRLRMELAAEQGAEHLAAEIDKRLGALETSRGKISWRRRAAFIRDLNGLRDLIAERLAPLDRAAALNRLWLLMRAAEPLSTRVKDKDGAMAAVFDRAAADIGALLTAGDGQRDEGEAGAEALVEAATADAGDWADWLPIVLARTTSTFAAMALRRLSQREGATALWLPLVRQLADAAGDVDAYVSTFTTQALKAPANAADAARRYLAAGRIVEAGETLGAVEPRPRLGDSVAGPEFALEGAWIDYLDASGAPDKAQALRWSSFERTLSPERAQAFVRRLKDFDDVEAEARAFDHAARHPDFARALRFLMDWPAPAEAGRMIEARPDDIDVSPEDAELWAGKLRRIKPKAAHHLLRKAAAAAFRRRQFALCDRLTAEADAIEV